MKSRKIKLNSGEVNIPSVRMRKELLRKEERVGKRPIIQIDLERRKALGSFVVNRYNKKDSYKPRVTYKRRDPEVIKARRQIAVDIYNLRSTLNEEKLYNYLVGMLQNNPLPLEIKQELIRESLVAEAKRKAGR